MRKFALNNGSSWLSALGHKQTCAVQKVMSALPPIADIRRCIHGGIWLPVYEVRALNIPVVIGPASSSPPRTSFPLHLCLVRPGFWSDKYDLNPSDSGFVLRSGMLD